MVILLRSAKQDVNMSRQEIAQRESALRGRNRAFLRKEPKKPASWRWIILSLPLGDEDVRELEGALSACSSQSTTFITIRMVLDVNANRKTRERSLKIEELKRRLKIEFGDVYQCGNHFFESINRFLERQGVSLRLRRDGGEFQVWWIPAYAVKRMQEQKGVNGTPTTGVYGHGSHPDATELEKLPELWGKYTGGTALPQEKTTALAMCGHISGCKNCSQKLEEMVARESAGRSP